MQSRMKGVVSMTSTADAAYQADGSALLKDVDPEASEAWNAVGDVELLGLLEFLSLGPRCLCRSDCDHVFEMEFLLVVGCGEVAADAQHGVAADLYVNVRCNV